MLQPITIELSEFGADPAKFETHLLAGGFLSIGGELSLSLTKDSPLIVTAYLQIEGSNDLSRAFLKERMAETMASARELLSKLPETKKHAATFGLEIRLNEDYGSGSFTWCRIRGGVNIEWLHPDISNDA